MKYEARNTPAVDARADVLRLWNGRAAGGNDALYQWGYLDNPFAPAACFLLCATEGSAPRVVGSVAVGARRVEACGETLSAALLGDFFVEKAHRTFFPALVLQRAVLGYARKSFDLVYGFPNDSARPLIEKLGFRAMARLQRHVLVLRHARYLAPRVGSKIAASVLALPFDLACRFVHPGTSFGPRRQLVFERVDAVDDRFDRLFRARAFRGLTAGVRDAKLLRWRFIERPNERCAVYVLRHRASGELRGYAVVHVANDVAFVRDLLGVDVDAMADTLVLTAGEARRRGCSSLSFLCAAPPALEERLTRIGFRVRNSERPRILYGHLGDTVRDSGPLSGLEDWYATEADEDQ